MYELHDYARMIADEARLGPYVRALEAVVRPGSVVADIGTGTGILALVACRLGARRVFAIETNDAIEVGRELARENGVADRIVFFQNDAQQVELPERADVIVSDLRGTLPISGDHLAIISDARNRFLKPGGVLVPAQDRLLVAAVERRDLYDWALGPERGPLGVTLEAIHARLRNSICRDRETNPLQPTDVLSTVEPWASLDYATLQAATVAGRADLRVERAGVGHGLAVWFETLLAHGHGFTTGPGHELCYGRLFMPWPHPVELSAGDCIKVDVWAQLGGNPWGWNSRVTRKEMVRESFKQSSFLSLLSKPTVMERGPRVSDAGRKLLEAKV